MTITVEVPIKTPNITNQREHHMARHRRAKAQRGATMLALKTFKHHTAYGVRAMLAQLGEEPRLAFMPNDRRLVVTLTRRSPGALDAHDNLRAALKSVVDAVAEYFEVDDANPRLEWRYAQVRGKANVRIDFEVVR